MGTTSTATRVDFAAGGLVAGAESGPILDSIPLAKNVGRLRAAAHILAEPPAADGRSDGCADDCACGRAAAVTDGPYVFPSRDGAWQVAVTTDGLPIVCTLDADGGDLVGRVGEWQSVLGAMFGG